jgi:uncharacterized protein
MAGEGINPFNYSDPVEGGDLVGRRPELGQLIDIAWSGNNARLSAPRRYGKTSLLQATLAEADAQGFVVVYVDFFGVLTLDDIADRIEAAYLQGLKGPIAKWFNMWRRTLGPITRFGGGAIPAQLELSLGRSEPILQRLNLPLKIHEHHGKRSLIAFDEFQDVMQANGADAVIRSAIQHHGRAASYIFAGSHVHMMAELFGDTRRAFYAQARPIALPALPSAELGAYIDARFTSTGKEVGEGLGHLLDAAQGHPQRAMLLAHLLWERTPAGGTATPEGWFDAYTEVLASARDGNRAGWDRLPTPARRVITVIAAGQVGVFSRSSGITRGATTARAVSSLLDRGEIIEDQATVSGYRVVDPLFAEWIRAGRKAA